MADAPVKRSAGHQPRGRFSPKNSQLFRRLGLLFLAIALTGTSAALTVLHELSTTIRTHDAGEFVEIADRPSQDIPTDIQAGHPVNILLIGSDNREGYANTSGTVGMRSDTTMIAHISADRSRVDVVSIPRDTLVNIPECKLGDGTMTAPRYGSMFNTAFARAGIDGNVNAAASCTLRTVEDMTGIYINGYVVVDFAAFVGLVDALGGVKMCFGEPVNDSAAGLNLSAGCHVLDGDQALGVARVRKSIGDGSDIARINRQHELVRSIIKHVLEDHPSDPRAMYGLIESVAEHMDMSSSVGNLKTLAGLMYSLRNLSEENVNFMTMPFDYAGNRVVANTDTATVWNALINDQPVPESAFANQLEIPTTWSSDAVPFIGRGVKLGVVPPAAAETPSTDPTPAG